MNGESKGSGGVTRIFIDWASASAGDENESASRGGACYNVEARLVIEMRAVWNRELQCEIYPYAMQSKRRRRSGGRAIRSFVIVGLLLGLQGCSKSKDTPVADSAAPGVQAGEENAASADELTAQKAKLPTAESLLAKHVEAAGGQAAIDSFKSVYTEGRLEVEAQNLSGKVRSWWKDGRFYIEESIEGVGKTRAGYDGETVWSDDPISQLRELEGAEAEQYAWASCLFLAAQWNKFFERAETVGERESAGRKLYDVQLTTESGIKVQVSFDGETGLMVEQKFDQQSAMGKIPLTVRLSDYRTVAGYKFPHRQETETPILSGVQVYDKIEVNPNVDDALFTMPVDNERVPADPNKQKPARMRRK